MTKLPHGSGFIIALPFGVAFWLGVMWIAGVF
jgi:hypothetical protein